MCFDAAARETPVATAIDVSNRQSRALKSKRAKENRVKRNSNRPRGRILKLLWSAFTAEERHIPQRGTNPAGW